MIRHCRWRDGAREGRWESCAKLRDLGLPLLSVDSSEVPDKDRT